MRLRPIEWCDASNDCCRVANERSIHQPRNGLGGEGPLTHTADVRLPRGNVRHYWPGGGVVGRVTPAGALAGAVGLTAAVAVLTGILLILLAFRLRGLKDKLTTSNSPV